MASAEAKYFYAKHNLPVVFCHSKTGAALYSEVFKHNPKILERPKSGQKCVVVRNHGGTRPYHLGYDGERFHWNYKFRAEPGELFLTNQEKKLGIAGAVIVEPHVKEAPLSKNKAWPWERWQELVESLPLPWVQLGPKDTETLNGVKRGVTRTFREALGWIYNASLIVTTDGALHHAAAAFGKPAVVLWGGLAPPQVLGYDSHTNLCHATNWCGLNKPCEHCKEAMESITVEEVRNAIKRLREAN